MNNINRQAGYGVQWEDRCKYITFTTPEGWKVRDNKLFDERFLNNLELYFAMGGCDGAMLDTYCDYVTPYHDDSFTMTCIDGLINFLGDILSTAPKIFIISCIISMK